MLSREISWFFRFRFQRSIRHPDFATDPPSELMVPSFSAHRKMMRPPRFRLAFRSGEHSAELSRQRKEITKILEAMQYTLLPPPWQWSVHSGIINNQKRCWSIGKVRWDMPYDWSNKVSRFHSHNLATDNYICKSIWNYRWLQTYGPPYNNEKWLAQKVQWRVMIDVTWWKVDEIHNAKSRSLFFFFLDIDAWTDSIIVRALKDSPHLFKSFYDFCYCDFKSRRIFFRYIFLHCFYSEIITQPKVSVNPDSQWSSPAHWFLSVTIDSDE
jgi:hypothetical protein